MIEDPKDTAPEMPEIDKDRWKKKFTTEDDDWEEVPPEKPAPPAPEIPSTPDPAP